MTSSGSPTATATTTRASCRTASCTPPATPTTAATWVAGTRSTRRGGTRTPRRGRTPSAARSSTRFTATRTGTASSQGHRWSTGCRCSRREPSPVRVRRPGTSTGNSDYVVFGGEFPRINNVGQQGLVRFARRSISPRLQGPRFTNNQIVPTLVPRSPTSVRVSWEAGFDYDDLSLTYRVFRNSNTLVYTTSANSNWWTLPSLGFVDTVPGPGTYSYRIEVRDSDNHVVNGAERQRDDARLRADERLRQPGARRRGATVLAAERAGSGRARSQFETGQAVSDGRSDNGVTWGHAGAIQGDTAAQLTTTNEWSRIFANGTETAPDTFTAQVWIRTTTTTRRPHPRLRRPPDRQLRPPGPAHLHEQRRPDHLRRPGPEQPDAHDHEPGDLPERPVAPGHGDDGPGRDAPVRRRARSWAAAPTRPRARRTSATGGSVATTWAAGRARPGNVNFVNGWVDEVAIYPTALTARPDPGPVRRTPGWPCQPAAHCVVHCDGERVVGERQRVGVVGPGRHDRRLLVELG